MSQHQILALLRLKKRLPVHRISKMLGIGSSAVYYSIIQLEKWNKVNVSMERSNGNGRAVKVVSLNGHR